MEDQGIVVRVAFGSAKFPDRSDDTDANAVDDFLEARFRRSETDPSPPDVRKKFLLRAGAERKTGIPYLPRTERPEDRRHAADVVFMRMRGREDVDFANAAPFQISHERRSGVFGSGVDKHGPAFRKADQNRISLPHVDRMDFENSRAGAGRRRARRRRRAAPGGGPRHGNPAAASASPAA